MVQWCWCQLLFFRILAFLSETIFCLVYSFCLLFYKTISACYIVDLRNSYSVLLGKPLSFCMYRTLLPFASFTNFPERGRQPLHRPQTSDARAANNYMRVIGIATYAVVVVLWSNIPTCNLHWDVKAFVSPLVHAFWEDQTSFVRCNNDYYNYP